MCYRNGTGHRCECCGYDIVELKIIPHDHKKYHEEKEYGMDHLNDEKNNNPLNNQKALEPVLMIVAMPGDQILIIPEIEANEYLSSFEVNDSISDAPGLDLVMSYDKDRILHVWVTLRSSKDEGGSLYDIRRNESCGC